MMCQFEVITTLSGRRYLTYVDISCWDYMWGFHRVIKELHTEGEPPIEESAWFRQREEDYENRCF